MAKRARVKGKGADIFFSEDSPTARSEAKGRSGISQQDALTKASEELIKGTFYFTQQQLDALERAVFVLRQEHRIKTNKSEVMRVALDLILKDLEQNQGESVLIHRACDRTRQAG